MALSAPSNSLAARRSPLIGDVGDDAVDADAAVRLHRRAGALPDPEHAAVERLDAVLHLGGPAVALPHHALVVEASVGWQHPRGPELAAVDRIRQVTAQQRVDARSPCRAPGTCHPARIPRRTERAHPFEHAQEALEIDTLAGAGHALARSVTRLAVGDSGPAPSCAYRHLCSGR